jgi:hypothetical protein
LVERVLGKDEVLGSNPSGSFRAVLSRLGEMGLGRGSKPVAHLIVGFD